MVERGQKLDKMVLHTGDPAELFFDNVQVSEANELGDAATGFKYLTHSLVQVAFGRPIGVFQDSRLTLTAVRVHLDALEIFLDQTVLEHNRGELSAEIAIRATWRNTISAG